MKNKEKELEIKDYCYRCGSLEVKKLSDGWLLCQNKKCLATTRFEDETDTLTIKFKTK